MNQMVSDVGIKVRTRGNEDDRFLLLKETHPSVDESNGKFFDD